jgi:hypothetical protein
MKIFETNKLHYAQYLYKLDLTNAFAPFFRTEFQKGRLLSAKAALDEAYERIQNGLPLYRTVYRAQVPVSDQDFFDAKIIYNNLLEADNYKLRVNSWHTIIIYSNDKEFLLKIANEVEEKMISFWEPKQENIKLLTQRKKILIVDHEPEFIYKVSLNYKRIDPNFGNWIDANPKLVKCGKKALQNIKEGYAFNNYFYVKNSKVLSLLNLMIIGNISRIEELVCNTIIDK